jgi:hypothetical protein
LSIVKHYNDNNELIKIDFHCIRCNEKILVKDLSDFNSIESYQKYIFSELISKGFFCNKCVRQGVSL